MEIKNRVENGVTIIEIEGRMDASNAAIAEAEINKALEDDQKRLLFDLSELEYLSSGGLRVILGAAKEMRRREGKVALAALAEYVYEIFEISGFTAMIPIKDTIEEGMKEVSS
jgi:anti-sigma B factor antagonist/stage II sporulation protein AA (anti-sigma F factor antagonist)